MKTLIKFLLVGVVFCFFGCTKAPLPPGKSDGKYQGQGTMTWSNGDKYEGEWKDGELHGQGTLTWSSGEKYVGEFKNDKEWNTTEYDKNGNIIGKFVNGEYIEQ